MRRSWQRAVALGNVIGHTPALGEFTQVEEPSPESPIGHVVQGPDFRVRNKDPSEAADRAVALTHAGGRASEVEHWQDIAEELHSAVVPDGRARGEARDLERELGHG